MPGAAVLPRVHLTASRQDAEFARRIVQGLAERDIDAAAGPPAPAAAADRSAPDLGAMIAAEAVVFLVSPSSIASPGCREELALALEHHKRLLPVLAEDLDPAAAAAFAGDSLGAALGRLHWIPARAHDEFDRAMDRIAEQVRLDLAWVRSHSTMLQRAIAWSAAGQSRRALPGRRQRREAIDWLARSEGRSPSPTALQARYVLAARQDDRGRGGSLPGLLGFATATLLVVAVAVAWLAAAQSLQRDAEGSRRLAALAPTALDSGAPQAGLLLAALAHQRQPTVEATQAMLSTLDGLRGLRGLPDGVHAPFGLLALSDDGRLAAALRCDDDDAAACVQRHLSILDTTSGRVVATRRAPQDIDAVAFAPDGRQVAIASCCDDTPLPALPDGRPLDAGPHTTVRLFDLPASGPAADGAGPPALEAIVREFGAPGGPLGELAFDGPERLLGRNEHLLRWHVPTGRLEEAQPRSGNLADRRHQRLLEVQAPEPAMQDVLVVHRLAPAGPRTDAAAASASGGGASSAGGGENGAGDIPAGPASDAPRAPATAVVAETRFPLGGSIYHQATFAPRAPLLAAISCAAGQDADHCNGELRLYDLAQARARGPVQLDQRSLDPLMSLAFLDDRWLVTGGCGESTPSQPCARGQLRLWSVRGDGLRPAGAGQRVPGREVLRIASAGGTVATIGADGRLAFWSAPAATLDATQAWPSPLEVSRTVLDEASLTRCDEANAYHPLLQSRTLGLPDAQATCQAIAAFDPGWPHAVVWDAAAKRLLVGGCREVSANGACIAGLVAGFRVRDGRLEAEGTTPLGAGVTALALAPGEGTLAIATCVQADARGCGRGASIETAPSLGVPTRMQATGLPLVGALAFDGARARLGYATCIETPPDGAPVGACPSTALRLLAIDGGAAPGGDLGRIRTAVRALAFSADGARLAAGDIDGDLTLWDTAARLRLGPALDVHFEPIEALSVEADGQLLAVTGRSRSRWQIDPAAWVRIACGLAGRDLAEAERVRWLGPEDAGRSACAADGATPARSAATPGARAWDWWRTQVAHGMPLIDRAADWIAGRIAAR